MSVSEKMTVIADAIREQTDGTTLLNLDQMAEEITDSTERLLSLLGRTLSTFTIPKCVETIGSYAFAGCTALATVRFNGTPLSIASDAFAGCTKPVFHLLTETDVTNAPWGAEEPTYYIGGVKYRPSTASSRLGQYVVDTPNSDFKGGVVNILGVIGTHSVTELNSATFRNKTTITEVVISAELKYIEANVFSGCTGLTKATFKGKPSSLPATVFANCTNLTEINVPWAEGAVANAPWGAENATINYNYAG